MWQEMIVGASVVMAGWFVVRRYWPQNRQKNGPKDGTELSGCAACSGCGKSARSCGS